VMVGMVSMFISPLQDLRSMALGCMLVVMVGVLATLTLLPALLALLGPAVDEPKALSRWVRRYIGREADWRWWAETVVGRPYLALGIGLALVVLLGIPTVWMTTGMPEGTWMPPTSESRRGWEMLMEMGHSGLATPIRILVQGPPGQSMLTRQHLMELDRLVKQIQHEPRVESVQSLVSVDPGIDLDEYIANYEDPSMLDQGVLKDAVTALNSKDTDATVINVVPANGITGDPLRHLVDDLRRQPVFGDFHLTVGGYAGWIVDFRTALGRAFPPIITMAMVLTWLALYRVFRSWLLPLKAILMNLLSVGTSFGVLVMVFQWGWMAPLFNLDMVPGRIVVAVPLMLFCTVFGLSMDYEVFLVTRIQEFYDECGDNNEATIRGLAATGSMITSAALIMVVVFFCFSLADMVMVKMLGLGLAVAVAVDATIVRIALVPAFMRLLGAYNWLPGRPLRSR
ncbi:MAG: MMPL family transporter, partial [Candidatus Xenobia bacterium]